MSGIQNAGVSVRIFTGTEIKSNFPGNLGYGVQARIYPRSPRFSFDD